MKILLLVLAICLLAKVLKGIPIVFSNKKLAKSLEDMKKAADTMKEQTKWNDEGVRCFTSVVAYILYFSYGIIYLIYGFYINELPLLLLTVINLCQIFIIDIPSMNKAIRSNYKAYGKLYSNRLYRFVNLLINISFYGLVIYYLVLKIIH